MIMLSGVRLCGYGLVALTQAFQDTLPFCNRHERNDKSLTPWRRYLSLVILLAFSLIASEALAAKPLTISKAQYNRKQATLQVITQVRNLGGSVTILHGGGGLLDEQAISGKKQIFFIPLARLGQVPCSVEARSGELHVSKPVVGAPADCKKTPICKIDSPDNWAHLIVNETVDFKASVKIKDKKAKDLKYEWDFGGGVFDNSHPNTMIARQIKFVRDNSQYRIRFSATDSQNRRCEAAIDVSVGTPPADLPPKVAEQPAPLRGEESNGVKGDIVVLPSEEWSMQHTSDMKTANSGMMSFVPIVTTLNAQVIEKGGVGSDKPRFLSEEDVKLRYSAASSPFDPVGEGSINSTSQNWPLSNDPSQPTPLDSATIAKTDMWQLGVTEYGNLSWAGYPWHWSYEYHFTELKPDEGYYINKPHTFEQVLEEYKQYGELGVDYTEADIQADLDTRFDSFNQANDLLSQFIGSTSHGQFMPGIASPYVANDPQSFTKFDIDRLGFSVPMIPLTNVDDRGRVNNYPLLRVEATALDGQSVVAKTDGVVSVGGDLHCRECHALGKIAANPNAGHTERAAGFTPYSDYAGATVEPCDQAVRPKPQFRAALSDSLFDQEWAAVFNSANLHGFYDTGKCIVYDGYEEGTNYMTRLMLGGAGKLACAGYCHNSNLQMLTSAAPTWGGRVPALQMYAGDLLPQTREAPASFYYGNYSTVMHRFHGEMQYNQDKTDIVRNADGAYQRWDWKTQGSNNKEGTSLFPIFDATGKQLPMEKNCLQCHAGHREQLYRDRMSTAGVTCYDCHGDMGAVGQAFTKDPAKTGSLDRANYRVPWLDETDCGSCHTGNANKGKTASDGYFSGGVMKQAFDSANPAAISRPVDKANPDAIRFAVVPDSLQAVSFDQAVLDSAVPEWTYPQSPTGGVNVPLYRFGQDQHGYVACASCHGAAHAVVPNRDPQANDNVTAIQLQGYPGPIYECNVCHTADAFNTEDSIGSTLHYADKDGKPTILAGPHNTHPINDPNWYLNERSGNNAQPNQTDGSLVGGWHGVWSGKPGLRGEDQCAACHGDDHLGTRLSKAPVDRNFDFSKLDFKKLKKAGFKSKIIKVKAGTSIGCNTCHSLEASLLNTPSGAVTQRHAPIIAEEPAPQLIIGQTFTYQVNASDVDGDTLTYSLSNAPSEMSIDANGKIHWEPGSVTPYSETTRFVVHATDTSGLYSARWFAVKPACPNSAPNWDAGMSLCSLLKITSLSPSDDIGGLNAGEVLNYMTTTNIPANFSIIDAVTGLPPTFTPLISIDAQTGALNWTPDSSTAATVNFRILATAEDNPSHQASQDISLSICQLPNVWDAEWWECKASKPINLMGKNRR